MGKLSIGLLAFAAGALVGAAAAGYYFKQHALGLTAQGVADKIFGQGSAVGKVAAGLGDTIEGLSN